MQKMLSAIHLSLENTFVAPLIPWRLPGDRKPSLTEEKICTPFIQKTLSLTNPDFILIFGACLNPKGVYLTDHLQNEIHICLL
jgi:DNA polymerase